MTSSITPIRPEYMTMFLNAIDESTRKAYQICWDAFMLFLSKNWLVVMIFFVVVLMAALVRAVMGRWDMLGKVLYKYLFWGILLVGGLIWGPGIFLSDFFHLFCTIILYPVCYFLVGKILDKTGLRTP